MKAKGQEMMFVPVSDIAEAVEIVELVTEFLDILDTVEVSDNGREFHPTTISSCRCMTVVRLEKLLPRLRELCPNRDGKPTTLKPKHDVDVGP